jgi:hypothetical protein
MTVREGEHRSPLLDPTSERQPAQRERAPRPASLEGLTVGLLDIAKARGDVFLDRLEELLAQRGLRVARFRKPTFTKVLPPALAGEIATQADVVVEALAD